MTVFPRHPQHAKMRREVDYFDANIDTLWQQYPNQFVAVHNQVVIDSDQDEWTLIRRIRATYPNETILIRKATGKPVPDLYVRSPRFVRE